MCLPQDAQKLCPTIFPGTGSYISVTKFPSETLLCLQVCHICPIPAPQYIRSSSHPFPAQPVCFWQIPRWWPKGNLKTFATLGSGTQL